MDSRKIKPNPDYKPLLKIGDKILCVETKKFGTIKQIDNRCSKLYDDRYENPGHLEYYVKWSSAWTRHDCFIIDGNHCNRFKAGTKAAKVLYSTPKIKKGPAQRSPRR